MSQKDLYDIILCIKMVSTWATILYIAHIKKKMHGDDNVHFREEREWNQQGYGKALIRYVLVISFKMWRK